MKTLHGSQSASIAREDFGFPEAMVDSPVSFACLERVGLIDDPHNRILELLGLFRLSVRMNVA